MPRTFQHDDVSNEENAARAHYAMKWMYRAHNVLLLTAAVSLLLAPKKDRADRILSTAAVLTCGLGVWINGEAGQWHQRAAEEHERRAHETL
jgi:hypothetical protein